MLLDTTMKSNKTYMKMTPDKRHLLYRLALETGLRSNELRSLTGASFNLGDPSVTISSTHAKNSKEATLPLKRGTAKLVQSHISIKKPQVNLFEKMADPSSVARMLRKDCADARAAWIEQAVSPQQRSERMDSTFLQNNDSGHIDFHGLRHTFGTMLAASGVHPKTIQTLMRHSDINLTMSRYSHSLREHQASAIEKLPDFESLATDKAVSVSAGA